MTDRLKNDVLFVNVDGMLDYFDHENKSDFRHKKVNKIKSELVSMGLRVLLLNPKEDSDIQIPFFPINTDFNNRGYIDYSVFLLKYLYDYIKHESFTHIIIFQYDGYPINLHKWDDSFLDYEYIGRMDLNQEIQRENFFSFKENRKGIHFNGGFTLRSRSLLERCKNIPIEEFIKMNDILGCTNEDLLILDYIDYNKIPKKLNIIRKFVDKSNKSDSFGFHIT